MACTIRWRRDAGSSTIGHRLALLMRSPSERALDARIAEGHANAGTIDADRPRTRSAAGSHLKDARRAIREREEQQRSREFRLSSAALHSGGVSPTSQAPSLRSNSIFGPLDRQINEEPDIPPRNPARAGTAPVSRPSVGIVDEVSRVNDTTRSLSTSDASATNPGHSALGLLKAFSPPKPRRGREDSGLTGNGPSKPGDDAFDGADGHAGSSTAS